MADMPTSLDHLIERLRRTNVETPWQDILDAMWLARQMPISPESVPRPIDKVDVKPPEDVPDGPLQPPQPPSVPARSASDSQRGTIPRRPDAISPPSSVQVAVNVPDSPTIPGPAGGASLGIGVPLPAALPDKLALSRRLRPFKRRIPSRQRWVLNETATVEQSAEQGLWLPALRPVPARWFEVALVIDEALTMSAWQPTLREWRKLLERHGSFHDVRVWRIDTTLPDGRLPLYVSRSGSLHDVRELADPTGRRIVLLASDCVSRAWWDGRAWALLEEWGRHGPVGLLQMLPHPMWKRTALSAMRAVYVRSTSAGGAASRLRRVRRPQTYISRISHPLPPLADDAVPIPVLAFDPALIGTWADLVTRSGVTAPAYARPPETSAATTGPGPAKDLPAAESSRAVVAEFKDFASPPAQRLAMLCAAAPLRLPVIRLIQRVMLPGSGQIHLAEFLLGGLLRLAGDTTKGRDADAIEFEFLPGVTDVLLDEVDIAEPIGVVNLLMRERVSGFIAENLGGPADDFMAMLNAATPDGTLPIGPRGGQFATVATRLLRRLGGAYQKFADTLVPDVSPGLIVTPVDNRRSAIGQVVAALLGPGNVIAHLMRHLLPHEGEHSNSPLRAESPGVQQNESPTSVTATSSGSPPKAVFRVRVAGSFQQVGERADFAAVCRDIGRALAAGGHTLVFSSAAENTGDFEAFRGYLSSPRRPGQRAFLAAHTFNLDKYWGKVQQLALTAGEPLHVEQQPCQSRWNAAAHASAFRQVDAVILVGGGSRTTLIAQFADAFDVPILAQGEFGGVAGKERAKANDAFRHGLSSSDVHADKQILSDTTKESGGEANLRMLTELDRLVADARQRKLRPAVGRLSLVYPWTPQPMVGVGTLLRPWLLLTCTKVLPTKSFTNVLPEVAVSWSISIQATQSITARPIQATEPTRGQQSHADINDIVLLEFAEGNPSNRGNDAPLPFGDRLASNQPVRVLTPAPNGEYRAVYGAVVSLMDSTRVGTPTRVEVWLDGEISPEELGAPVFVGPDETSVPRLVGILTDRLDKDPPRYIVTCASASSLRQLFPDIDLAAPTRAPVPTASVPEKKPNLWEMLGDLAVEYESVRARMSAGYERTGVMAEIIQRARRRAGSTTFDTLDFDTALSGTPGQRIIALAVVPSSKAMMFHPLVAACIIESRSAFEQWTALQTVLNLWSTASRQAQEQWCDVINGVLARLQKDADQSRYQLARTILARPLKEPEAAQ